MGFYGNISNATRTQFTFDRIYPSRKAMEDAQAVDGVYVGRYVLVEYDSDVHTDYYERVYKVDGKLYRSNTHDVKTELTVSNTVNTQIVRVEPDNYPDNVAGTTEFYLLKHINGQLRFELIAGNDSNYSSNYNVDLRAFYGEGGGRGYDSTVWQKVYTEGIEKYVMVAELNTVVPTFDITADAPTMAPRLPHFDADSTNVYYKVHWQPQWGVRVKGAQSYQTPQLNDDGSQRVSAGDGTPLTVNSSDDIIYPSDYSTEWTRHEYKRETGEAPVYYATVDEANNLDWEESTEYSEVPAAIYFNKAGFSPDKITYSSHYDADNKTTTTYKDYNNISIAPTGRSGHRYSTHQNGAEHECDVDIQEMSIMLPGIGDTIAKLWDMVYGDEIVNHGRNRNKNIQWNSVDGIRMVSTNHGYDANGNLINTNGFTYNKNGHISTIAGCINSVHDLMGMIIQDPSKEDFEKYQNDASSLADNLIYYYQGAYYRKKKIFNFNKLEHNNYIFREIPIGEDNYQSNTYYCLVGGKYVEDLGMEYDSNKVYYERIIDATGSYDPVEFTYEYAPNIWYTKGHNDTYTLATEECINPDEIYYIVTPERIEISNDYVTDTYFRPSEGQRIHEYEYRKGYEKELDNEGNKVPIMEKISDTHTIRDFNLSRTPQATPGESYYRLTFKEIDITENGAKFIYEPGKFFYDPTPEDAIGQYKLSNDLHPVEGRQYLYGEVGDSSTKEYTTWDEETQSYITITEEIYEFITPPYPVEVVDIANYKEPKQEIDAEGNPIFNEDGSPKYIMEGDKPKLFNVHIYIPEPVALTEEEISAGITEPPADLLNWKQLTYNPTDYTGPYYCIDENERIDSFYSYGQFWYVNKSELDESNPNKKPLVYMIDNSPSSNSDRIYFKIEAKEIEAEDGKELVYKPGRYYYLNNNLDYVIDYYPSPTTGREYFKTALFYVLSDTYNLFGKGSEWNPNVELVPCSIELATRSTSYTVQPLHGFARTLNTIHGLILKVNDLLEVNDFDTRDLSTVQGCINNLKDIIAKFGVLAPQEFVIVDNYGRVSGADFSTLQKTSYDEEKRLLTVTGSEQEQEEIREVNEQILLKEIDGDLFKEVSSLEDMRQQWITANVNGSINKPFVSIHHNFQKVTDTTSTVNKNTDNVASNSTTDKINLYTPIVDAMGHVVGKNTETVTLPYGFKTITTNGRGSNNVENAKGTPSTSNVVAENTQDTLAINSGNKWIRIDSNANNDSLTIYHDVHDTSTSTSADTLSSETAVTTFDIPTYSFDGAGHYVSHDTKTLTMPFGYGIITGDSGTSTSSATFDTLKIASGDAWLETAASKDTLTITHTGPVIPQTLSSTANVTPNFGATFTLEDWHFDDKGHKCGLTTHTVMIPNLRIENANSGNVITDLGISADGQKVKEIKSNVGNLKLADYVIGNNANVVAAEDTINQAFGKVQTQITNEVANRQQAIAKEVEDRNTAISNAISTEVTNRNTAITNAINTEVTNRDTAITNAINAEVNNRNTAISEAINTEIANRNTAISDAFNNTTFNYGDITLDPTVQQQTIEWLFKKVAELEAQVIALTNPTI